MVGACALCTAHCAGCGSPSLASLMASVAHAQSHLVDSSIQEHALTLVVTTIGRLPGALDSRARGQFPLQLRDLWEELRVQPPFLDWLLDTIQAHIRVQTIVCSGLQVLHGVVRLTSHDARRGFLRAAPVVDAALVEHGGVVDVVRPAMAVLRLMDRCEVR